MTKNDSKFGPVPDGYRLLDKSAIADTLEGTKQSLGVERLYGWGGPVTGDIREVETEKQFNYWTGVYDFYVKE